VILKRGAYEAAIFLKWQLILKPPHLNENGEGASLHNAQTLACEFHLSG